MTGAGHLESWHSACLICGGRSLKPLPNYADAHLVRCGTCGFTFSRRRADDAELASHYRAYGSGWHDSELTRRRYRELLESFEPYRQTNRILDIGCGAGFFLEEARHRGWDVYGTEFGEQALDLARAKQIEVVEAPLIEGAFDADSFDVVTAFEVVEHLRDPLHDLMVITRLMREEGLFYCTTPNFNSASRRLLGPRWRVIAYPEHLCYFTGSSLTRLAQRAGLTRVSMTSTGLSVGALRARFTPVRRSSPSPGVAQEEELRSAIERSQGLALAKTALNAVLSRLNAGDTLKGRFVLRSAAAQAETERSMEASSRLQRW